VFPLLGKGKQGGEHSITGPFGEVMASDIVPQDSVPQNSAPKDSTPKKVA
jgi:alkanesulfonate monooxygenase